MAALWRVEAAAEYLGIRPKTLYEWVRLGRVPYRKIGFNVRFDPDELAEWTAAQSHDASQGTSPAGSVDTTDVEPSAGMAELAGEAANAMRQLERDVGTSLSFPQRRRLLELSERLQAVADGTLDI